jgi:hypothetical protein
VFAVSTRTTLIEPLFYWPDRRTRYHERMIQPQHLARLPLLEAEPAGLAGGACTAQRSDRVVRRTRLRPPADRQGVSVSAASAARGVAQLLESIKTAPSIPRGLMNPGALGF